MRVRIYSQVPLSIFEPPLILRNRDRDRPRPIEFGIQTARLCQIAVRASCGGLKIISSSVGTTIDGTREEAAADRRGSVTVACGWNWPLTTSRPSFPYGAVRELMTREGRVLNFNVFNPEYQIFNHFSRPTYHSRRSSPEFGASPWDFINSTSVLWREWEKIEKRRKKGKAARRTEDAACA